MPCGCSGVGVGRSTAMLSMVSRTSFISFGFAPAILSPIGTPCPSVRRLRLTPLLPRSVGLGPLFSPRQRGFGHCAVHTQPIPGDPFQFVKAFESALPKFQKDACFYPFLKTRVCR